MVPKGELNPHAVARSGFECTPRKYLMDTSGHELRSHA